MEAAPMTTRFREIKGRKKPERNPELVLIARLLDALVMQLQNNATAANRISEKAWRDYETERPVSSDGQRGK